MHTPWCKINTDHWIPPASTRKVSRFHQTIFSGLQHYIEEHGRYWDAYLLRPTYACNAHVHRATKRPPFSLSLTWKPLGAANICPPIIAGTFNAVSTFASSAQGDSVTKIGEYEPPINKKDLKDESRQASTVRIRIGTRRLHFHQKTAAINLPDIF